MKARPLIEEGFRIVTSAGKLWYEEETTGRRVPFVSGAAPDDEDEDEDEDDDDDPVKGASHKNNKGRVLSETDLRRLLAREKKDGKKAGAVALVKELGFESPEALKTALEAVEAQNSKDESEKDKRIRQLERDLKNASEGSASNASLEGERILALVEAGMSVAAARLSAKLLADVKDPDDLEGAVEDLKKAMPQLFATTNGSSEDEDEDDKSTRPKPGSRMKNSAPGKPPVTSNRNPKTDPAKAAREMIEKRHPTASKKG